MSTNTILRVARSKRAARHVGFWWGLAEGVAFFIVPDVYVSLATLFAIRAGMLAWLFSIFGSLVAAGAIWLLVTLFGGGYLAFLDHIPGISRTLVETTAVRLTADGLPYTPLLILGGVPLKVYASLAATVGISLGALLLWTVFARIVRIAPVVALVLLVRMAFRRHVDARPAWWLALHATAWIAFYAFYFRRMR